MSADDRADDDRDEQEHHDRERRRVEEQLARADRHVASLEHGLDLRSSSPARSASRDVTSTACCTTAASTAAAAARDRASTVGSASS